MIQELFGGGNTATGLLGDTKISTSYSSSSPTTTCHATSSPLLTTTSSSSTSLLNSPSNNNNNNNNNSNSSENNNNINNDGQNLRCPRCDSTNTKFCYYNNYNLTQPRHFCKTCRRYWTKGGTLRNVPIGGGCRKNKTTISTNSSTANMLSKSSSTNLMAKAKASLSSEMLANDASLFLGNGFLDHHLIQPAAPSGQVLWSSLPPQNSHILSLLRGSSPFSNPNPNPNPKPTTSVFTNLGLDSNGTNGAPSLLGSFTRSNHHPLNGFSPEFGHNNGDNHNSCGNNTTSNILDLYQRLKASSNYGHNCGNDNENENMVGSTASSSSMSSSLFDATSLGGSGSFEGYGYMGTSPAISSWSEFPAVSINGSFS